MFPSVTDVLKVRVVLTITFASMGKRGNRAEDRQFSVVSPSLRLASSMLEEETLTSRRLVRSDKDMEREKTDNNNNDDTNNNNDDDSGHPQLLFSSDDHRHRGGGGGEHLVIIRRKTTDEEKENPSRFFLPMALPFVGFVLGVGSLIFVLFVLQRMRKMRRTTTTTTTRRT